jgi:hypothetical protein
VSRSVTEVESGTMTDTNSRLTGQMLRAERMRGMPPQRNRYTSLVKTYWKEYYPDQLAATEDPDAFVCRQAEALSDRVAELEQALAEADPVPEGEGDLAELNEARRTGRRDLGGDENRPNG